MCCSRASLACSDCTGPRPGFAQAFCIPLSQRFLFVGRSAPPRRHGHGKSASANAIGQVNVVSAVVPKRANGGRDWRRLDAAAGRPGHAESPTSLIDDPVAKIVPELPLAGRPFNPGTEGDHRV
jgi:hypothetical protein